MIQSTLIISKSGFSIFQVMSKQNSSPEFSCSNFHMNTNFHVEVSDPSTSLISIFYWYIRSSLVLLKVGIVW